MGINQTLQIVRWCTNRSFTVGILEEELYFALNLYCKFANQPEPRWLEIVSAGFDRWKLISRSKFTKLLLTLRTFLQTSNFSRTTELVITHQEISAAIRSHCKQICDKNLMNLYLAAYCYVEADPHNDCTWTGKNPRTFTNIIGYLLAANSGLEAEKVLTDLRFLNAKAKLGLSAELFQDYVTYQQYLEKNDNSCQFYESSHRFEEFYSFVTRNSHLLVDNPSAVLQQALNEPNVSVVNSEATKILKESEGALNVLHWMNKPQEAFACSFIQVLMEVPQCITVSACETLAAIGMKNGQIQLLNLRSMKITKIITAHANAITSLCFVDNNRLCSASQDSTLKLWDLNSGNRLVTMSGHTRSVSACVYHTESKSLVSVGWDCSIRVWNLQSGTELSVRKEKSPINSCACHPYRNVVAIGSWDSTVRIWDLVSLKRTAILRGHVSSVTSAVYSKCGSYIASSSLDGQVILWSSSYGFHITSVQAHFSRINQVCLNSAVTTLTSVADDHSVKIWSNLFASKTFLSIPSIENRIVAISSYSSSKQIVVALSNSTVMEIDCDTSIVNFSIRPSNFEITTLYCVEKFIVVGYFNGEIKIVSAGTGEILQSLQGHSSAVTCIANWQNDFISGTARGILGIHRTVISAENREISKIGYTINAHAAQVTDVCAHPCEKICVSVSRDSSLKVWDIDQHFKLNASMDHCHSDWINCCNWLIKGEKNYIVTGSNDNWIKLWEYEKEKITEIAKLGCLTGPVVFIDIWDQCVISGANNGNVKLFSAKGREVVSVDIGRTNCICGFYKPKSSEIIDWYEEVMEEELAENLQTKKLIFWPSGYLISANDSKLHVTQILPQLKPTVLSGHSDVTTSTAILQEGSIISCSADKTLRLWSQPTNNGDELNIGTDSEITAIALSRDNVWTVTGHRNGELVLWKNETQLAVNILQAHSEAINAICFVNWNVFVTASNDGLVIGWTLDENGAIKKKKTSKFSRPVLCIAYCPEFLCLVVGGWDGAYLDFGTTTEKKSFIQLTSEWVVKVEFAANNNLYAIQTNGNLSVFNWVENSNEKMLERIACHSMTELFSITTDYFPNATYCIPLCLALANEKFGLVGFSNGYLLPVNFRLKFLQMVSNRVHSSSVNCCAMESDLNLLVTVSNDRFVKVWNVNDGTETLPQVAQFECLAPVTTVCVSQNSPVCTIVCGDCHGRLYFLKLLQN